MMTSSGVVANEVTYNTMISAFAKQGNVPRASHWFSALQMAGRVRNEVSARSIDPHQCFTM
jgi:pentatricopeptide repeat protein